MINAIKSFHRGTVSSYCLMTIQNQMRDDGILLFFVGINDKIIFKELKEHNEKNNFNRINNSYTIW